MTLDELLQRAWVWRAGVGTPPVRTGLASGYAALDGILPGGGWPRSGLTEILSSATGIGALRLVLPALAKLSREGRWIIWVAPPHVPYSPALHGHGLDLTRVLVVELPEDQASTRVQTLWAYEQALRFSDCGAALLWQDTISNLRLRRLQVAAAASSTWGLVFRPASCSAQPSPAPLRLEIEALSALSGSLASASSLRVSLRKARGARSGLQCQLEL
jgi:protein ImuA